MSVFVLTDAQKLVAMKAAAFDKEADFQELLVRFPQLLSGDRAEEASSNRWLLIRREQSVPAEADGAGRWSLDHLFVDQEGVPTLVEVKRQGDTRLRREVVGQMLDYAANAVAYWPVDQLRTEFEKHCSQIGVIPEELIIDQLNVAGGSNELWQRVKTNLQAGRIRLLFVADRVPSELRRIVEFLNNQMDPAEVLALELRQFQGEGLKTIVPVIYGQTEEARERKGVPTRQWDRESFFTAFAERNGTHEIRVAEQIANWIEANSDKVLFGKGTKDGSMTMMVVSDGQGVYPITLWTYGKIEIGFQYMMRGIFREEEKRQEFLYKLNMIRGLKQLPSDAITRRPSIPMSDLTTDGQVTDLLSAVSWLVGELRGK